MKYLTQSGIENFISESENEDLQSKIVTSHFVDTLKTRIEKVKNQDNVMKGITKKIKNRKKRKVNVDSDLQEFMI